MVSYLGQRINNYQLIKLLGHGSYAEVYLGEHVDSKEYAAVKLLHAYITDDVRKEIFLKEAHLIAELKHPHIIQLLDIGFIGTTPFLIMSYAQKGSMGLQYSEGSLLSSENIVRYTQQIASALQFSHNRNIIHCDVKPENILLDDKDNLILSDFGIARIVQSTRLQTTHSPEGTPMYMAPEQFRGKPRLESDQYALGVMVYEWLCGELPFVGKTFTELMDKHLKVTPPSLRARVPSISPGVEAVVLKALEKDPKKRFDNIQGFANALEEAFRTPGARQSKSITTIFSERLPLVIRLVIIFLLVGAFIIFFRMYLPQNPISLIALPVVALICTFIWFIPQILPEMFKTLQKLQSTQLLSLTAVKDNAEAPVNFRQDFVNQEIHHAGQAQRYTALDIGTAFAKAIIFEVNEDKEVVLGVGRHPQSYAHMSDGMVTDIQGVIDNCREAITKAEIAAGGIVAPSAIMGIAGELVKGSSITISKQRANPTRPITPEELESLITGAQQRLLKNAKERIAAETGYQNIEVRLTNAAVISVQIDGQFIANPIGFRGRYFSLTLFSAFAPLMQLGALETVAQGLDLTLVTIVAEPYALARCLSTNAGHDSGAIFIDIGGGTTDIALMRQGGIEETRMFALGGRTFTRRIATSKGISLKEAEMLKLTYSSGALKGNERDEIKAILAPECQTWIDSIELLLEEMSKGELLPPAIYLVGGGSALLDLSDKLENFPWTERLPFARRPIIQIIQPDMVASISDPAEMLKTAQDIMPMALAYQAVELQNGNNVWERALSQVIQDMHI